MSREQKGWVEVEALDLEAVAALARVAASPPGTPLAETGWNEVKTSDGCWS